MRTTLDLDDDLLRAVKETAAVTDRTMTAVIEEALRDYLREPPVSESYRLEWEPIPGRLQAGVDLSDRDSLYDRMEGRG